MKKLPPCQSRPPWLLASPGVVRLAALYAEHFVSHVPDIAQRARRRWRKSNDFVQAETDRKRPKNPRKRFQNAHEGPVLVDNGNGYVREQRMADDTVNAFYSIR
jgi:hypothetical protein